MIYGYDIETNCRHPFDEGARILTIASATSEGGTGAYVTHTPQNRGQCLEYGREAARSYIKSIDQEENIIVGHNVLMFDWYWTHVHITGSLPKAYIFDTQIAYSLIDEDADENSLEFLSQKYFGESKIGLDRTRLVEYPAEEVLEYNIQDAVLSRQLFRPIYNELEEKGLVPLYEFIVESGLTLLDMMVRGVNLDVEWLHEHEKALREEMDGYEKSLHDILGEDFNIRSSVQLSDLLFKRLGLPVKEKSKKTGKPSTGFSALTLLQRDPSVSTAVKKFLDLILKYRETKKLVDTYLSPFETKHRRSDGKIHTSFNIGKSFHWKEKSGTATGRLSSSGPNLQNLPLDYRIRGCLSPSSDNSYFCSADYSQLELRVMAWYANEKVMLEAFRTGRDIHTQTLALIKNWDYDRAVQFVKEGGEEAEKERRVAKTMNFLILYGGSGYRLMKTLFDMGIYKTVSECDEYIEKWFAAYPSICKAIDGWREDIIYWGYIVTPTGRIRHLPNADSTSKHGQHKLRQGVNFMVQSLASEVMLAALPILDAIEGADLLLTVHDSALLEYNPEYFCSSSIDQVVQLAMVEGVNHKLEKQFGIRGIPLKVDIKTELERWQ